MMTDDDESDTDNATPRPWSTLFMVKCLSAIIFQENFIFGI